MDIVVQKYGGTSVESKEKLKVVIDRIITTVKKNKRVVVVVSAQGKTTDILIEKANTYCDKIYNKEMDILLSTGEMQSMVLLTMMLKNKGYDAIGLTGQQAGIITDSDFSKAKIRTILSDNLLKHLDGGKIVVVAGFQGVDKFGNITTLGRGGSDLSAVAIAASLGAEKCEIYTDVDGVFSCDPNVIKKAKLLRNISYEEMLEAATAGAKVLHNRSVSLARKYNIPINVKNTRGENEGTVVNNVIQNNVEEKYIPKIIAIENDLAKITIVGDNLLSNNEYITKIYSLAWDNSITLYMVSFSEVSINIVVKQSKAVEFAELIQTNVIVAE